MLIYTIVRKYIAATHFTMLQVYEKSDECLHCHDFNLIVSYLQSYFSPSQEQYQTVFEAVLTYLDSFDTYANFQNL